MITYLSQCWELKQRFLNRAVIIHMNCVLEHIVQKVGVWLHKFIQSLQGNNITPLFLIEQVEVYLETEKLLVFQLLVQVGFLLSYISISFFQFFLFFLQGPDFFVDLLLHHLVEVLLLDI